MEISGENVGDAKRLATEKEVVSQVETPFARHKE
jgi:hypothetical protein